MPGNRTLAIIKPDAVQRGKSGAIIAHLEREGFVVRAAQLIRMSVAEAGAFYDVHRGRPFYEELVQFMSGGPCMPIMLERDNAVAYYRQVIGATDPAEADEGTIRRLHAESKGRNAVHGSDSDENAAREIAFFFPEGELASLWGASA
jgi:nucleoside-diphosphate kinase